MWYIYIIYDCQFVTVNENKEIKKKTKKNPKEITKSRYEIIKNNSRRLKINKFLLTQWWHNQLATLFELYQLIKWRKNHYEKSNIEIYEN